MLFSCSLSSGSCDAALDREYVSTYFWPQQKGVFLVVFRVICIVLGCTQDLLRFALYD